jgi:hypothetical protein
MPYAPREALALFRQLSINVESMSQRDFSTSYFALAKRYIPIVTPGVLS